MKKEREGWRGGRGERVRGGGRKEGEEKKIYTVLTVVDI